MIRKLALALSSNDLQPFTRTHVAALVISTVLATVFSLNECRAQADLQPGGVGADTEATKRAAELFDFQWAQKMDTKEGWEAFLKAHPTGVSAVWAKKRLAEIEKDARSRPKAGVAPRSEQAAVPPVERNGSNNASIRNVGLNLRYSTRKENRTYFNGKNTKSQVGNDESGWRCAANP